MTVTLSVFDGKLLSRSKSGVVWARIYFQFDGQTFPDKGWTDLAVAFVNAWLSAVMRVFVGSSYKETVRFLDGPLAVEISGSVTGEAKLGFIHKDVLRCTATARCDQLLRDASRWRKS